jgi:hypothetical protein
MQRLSFERALKQFPVFKKFQTFKRTIYLHQKRRFSDRGGTSSASEAIRALGCLLEPTNPDGMPKDREKDSNQRPIEGRL